MYKDGKELHYGTHTARKRTMTYLSGDIHKYKKGNGWVTLHYMMGGSPAPSDGSFAFHDPLLARETLVRVLWKVSGATVSRGGARGGGCSSRNCRSFTNFFSNISMWQSDSLGYCCCCAAISCCSVPLPRFHGTCTWEGGREGGRNFPFLSLRSS